MTERNQAGDKDMEEKDDEDNDDSNSEDEIEVQKMTDRLEILRYILDRYIRMRGCWFVKYMKDNEGDKSLGQKKLDAAPTNMKVAQLAEQSKKIAEALRDAAKAKGAAVMQNEQDLWNVAANAVLVYEENEDEENAII